MELRKALRLKKGDIIIYGHSMWSEKVDRDGAWQEGEVIHVTQRGGLKVRTSNGHTEWVPYHHVGRVEMN